MNDPSLQQKYEFALDYIRVLEARIKELEDMIKDWSGGVLEYDKQAGKSRQV